MSILTKKTKKVMVRVPKGLMEIIDGFVGKQYSSRPDFIVEAIRCYMEYISFIEINTVKKLEGRDESLAAKSKFYFETLELNLAHDKNKFKEYENKSEETVDVLLSVFQELMAEVNDIVERTQAFKNDQEFIKVAIVGLISSIVTRAVNTMKVNEFLQSINDTDALKEELKRLREEIEKNAGITSEDKL